MDKKVITDKIVLILVIVALAFSIAGAIISLNNLNIIDVTGFASAAAGYANATVAVTADISFVTSSVNFVSELANMGNDTSDDIPAPFNLTNDGNVCVNITTVRTQTNWLTGTKLWGGDENNNNYTQYAINSTGINKAYRISNTSWTNLSQSITSEAISSLNWTNGNDTAEIEIKIFVPADEASGAKSTLVTFAARDSLLNC